MMRTLSLIFVILLLLVGQTLAFSSPRQHSPSVSISSSALRLGSTDNDEVQKLLAKAKALREEAAAMSGQTMEEMEADVQLKKKLAQERQDIMDKARKEREEDDAKNKRSRMNILPVPDNAEAQILQAAAAVERAFADGITRQTVRFALLGEDEAMSGELNEWPGGAKQMFREAGRPLAESLLKEVRAYSKESSVSEDDEGEQQDVSQSSRMPPQVTTDDIWDFDGSALVTATASAGSHGDVKAVVFPNTDSKYLNDIEKIAKDVGPNRLLLLINPFCKTVQSWSFNILQPKGQQRAQEVIFDNGYDLTYAVLRFSARGEDCIALKSYPYDWQLYAYREDPYNYMIETPIWLGSSVDEPKSSQMTELLNSRPEFKMSKNMRQMQRALGNDDQ